MTERIGDFIETFTGKQFWPLDPRPEDVDISDIAHSLSMQCRFNGHCSRFYSVAEHSIIVAKELAARDYYPGVQLRGLLHDAAEAYICDIPRPIKRHIGYYVGLEYKVQKAIFEAFGLTPETKNHLSYMLRDIDNALLKYEAKNIMPNNQNWAKSITGLDLKLKPVLGLSPQEAKKQFIEMFHKLTDELKG